MQPDPTAPQDAAERRDEPDGDDARRSASPDEEDGAPRLDDEHDGGFGDGWL